jgi:hypothetical protein
MPNNRLTTAHKNHVCCLCHDPIPVGTQYVRQEISPWECGDGDAIFWTYKAHPECDKVWREVQPELADDLIPNCRGEWNDILELHAELPKIRAERERLRQMADEMERQRRTGVHA